MKASFSWLKDYVSISTKPQDLAHRLTMAGLEVEKIHRAGDDTVFEMEITPNRPDCLNHLGIAREISAIFDRNLNSPKIKKPKLPTKKADITIQDKKGCLRYIGALVKNISVKKTSSRILKRINPLGLRSVNNIVDITNFCLLETGQPMHAFDYDKLAGGKIIVRRAKQGEKIVAIDGNEYKLDSSILVIADTQRPVAIAGVMGGLKTEVSASTKNILLESAYFDPILIRRGARKLGLSSDSSYRFERGVDMDMVEKGAFRALSIILKEAGGKCVAFTDQYPQKQKKTKTQVTISKSQVDKFLGAQIPTSRNRSILHKLGFKVVSSKKDTLKITPPSFRNDIKQSVDVIEDIARIVGYDNLPVSLPLIKATSIASQKERIWRNTLVQSLCAQGLDEVITYSMISRDFLARTKQENLPVVEVKNPLSKEQEIMRPCLLPNFLSLAYINISRGQKDLAFFEAGKIYTPAGEREAIGIIMSGRRSPDWRQPSKEKNDFYDIKGAVEQTVQQVGIDHLQFVASPEPFFENGQSAHILLEDNKIGHIGQIHQGILSAWDIKQKEIFFAEIDAQALYANIPAKNRYQPVSGFPAIVRDISLVIKDNIPYAQVKAVIKKSGTELLMTIHFIEQYLGEKIPDGHCGLTTSLTFQSTTRTLREDEVNTIYQNICQALDDELGATLR